MAEPKPRATPGSRVAEQIVRHRDPATWLRTRRAKGLELFYEPGDPHSHLCAQLLPTLARRVRVPITVTLVGPGTDAEYPEADRQRRYAIQDAARIAPARGLSFPADARPPSPQARLNAARELAGVCTDPVWFATREAELAPTLFAPALPGLAGQEPPAGGNPTTQVLEAGRARRERLGQFLPAVWLYDGDWFWGVDRLHYLERRLRARGVLDGDEPLSELHPEAAALDPLTQPLPPLEFFFSFRSPYSYLAAVEMYAFHREWPSGVVVRPVLPMAMRGIAVPRAKRMYTVRDVSREARRRGIPFGRIADPIGTPAERCLQAFAAARGPEAQLRLLVSAAEAIWSEGIDLGTDNGLRHVCDWAGLDWAAVTDRLADPNELLYAEANRQALLDAGLWGVPCYRTGGFTAWGQDRFWMVRELLRRSAEPATVR